MSTAEVVVVGCMKTGNVIIPSSATNPSNGQKARVVEISNSAFANKTGIEMPPLLLLSNSPMPMSRLSAWLTGTPTATAN